MPSRMLAAPRPPDLNIGAAKAPNKKGLNGNNYAPLESSREGGSQIPWPILRSGGQGVYAAGGRSSRRLCSRWCVIVSVARRSRVRLTCFLLVENIAPEVWEVGLVENIAPEVG